MNRFSRGSMALVAVTLLSAVRAAAAPMMLEGIEPRLEGRYELYESIVHEAYDRLSILTRAGGTPVRFDLTDFRTYARRELDTVRFGDLVDLPGGPSINGGRGIEYSHGRERRIYHNAWWEERWSYAESEGGRRASLMLAEEALIWAASDEASLAEVTAVTTWRVTVSFEGRERSYRACAWWMDEDLQSERVRLIVNDNVVVGVGEAFADFDRMKELERELEQPRGEPRAEGDSGLLPAVGSEGGQRH